MRNGYLFGQNGIQKYKKLDLGAEPPRTELCRVSPCWPRVLIKLGQFRRVQRLLQHGGLQGWWETFMEPRELILHISEDVLNRLSTEDIILPKTSSFILKPGDLKDALAQYQTVLQTIKFLTLQHSCKCNWVSSLSIVTQPFLAKEWKDCVTSIGFNSGHWSLTARRIHTVSFVYMFNTYIVALYQAVRQLSWTSC